mmetsp:Transcript_2936/g.2470  ORF Transcript_2936/g.2470 Transcript_2936/m.2470 type:complete len:285 (+) Transcript_2936:94-948(+)
MLSILTACILGFTSFSKSSNGKRLLRLENDNEYELEKSDASTRRELIEPATIGAAAAVISAIAGTTVAGINVGNAIVASITDDGAIFTINNYFAELDLHLKGTHVTEGSTLQAPRKLVHRATHDNTGGAFDDSGPGDSAGFVQYGITDPDNSSNKYCIGYAWSSEADSLCDNSGSHNNYVVYSLSDRACPNLNTASDEHYYRIKVACKENDDKGGYTASGGNWGGFWTDAKWGLDQVGNARKQERSIGSNDGKIGITVAVSTPDGDRDHPHIRIDAGPSKKIFG